jgi:SAM-dependent methyltransferase
MVKYTHTIEMHNMQAPRLLVGYFLELGSIKSVIDVGCGLGTFLRAFKEKGIDDILGIDGRWCNKELLFKNIEPIHFKEYDLEKQIRLDRKFDLAISLEVAEHLSFIRAEEFVKDLCNLSDTIIFSAAIPFQGGDHHLNEQPLTFWINLFKVQGFVCQDIIRPKIWENKKIFWWYRQNIVVFRRSKTNENEILNSQVNIVHPDLLEVAMNHKEKNAIKRHLKLLFKAIKFRINGN